MNNLNAIPTPDSRHWPDSHAIVDVSTFGLAVCVDWEDDSASKFHPLWLRDNCACELCLHTVNREHLLDLRDIPEDICAAKVSVDTDGALRIEWSGDGHISRYNPAWLYANSHHQTCGPSHETALWDAHSLTEPISFTADCGEVSKELLHKVLLVVRSHGLARVRGLAAHRDVVEQFALRIGPIRETHFERIFDVVSRADSDSNAYTSEALAAHTDIPTRETPPGLQLLHCMVADAKGGESTMTDGFKVSADIKIQFPHHYEKLTTTKWCYANRAGEKDYRWEAPTIGLNDEGEMVEVRLLPFSRAPLVGDYNDVEANYAALRCFMEMANSPDYQIRYPFKAGDLVIFDNRRIMHGRAEFFPNTGDRELRGTYIERDDLLSKIREYQHRRAEQNEV